MQEAPGKLHHLAEQLLFDFAKQSRAPNPKGTGTATPRRTNDKKIPATGSRTQEPFRFPGLSKPPTSDAEDTPFGLSSMPR